jgi:hypothetical protein
VVAQRRCGEQGAAEKVGAAFAHDPARRQAVVTGVEGQGVEEFLDFVGLVEPLQNASLSSRPDFAGAR